MLKITGENLNAISYVTIDGREESVLSMTGSVNSSMVNSDMNNYSINKTILNVNAYLANKEDCDKDYAEFEERVLNSLK